MKEKKLIIGVTAIIVVVVLIAVAVFVNKGGSDSETTSAPVQGTNEAGESTSNYFDNIQVYEGDGETVTDEDGNVIGQKSDSEGEIVTDEDGNQVINIDMGGDDSETETDKDGKVVDKSGDTIVVEEDVEQATDENGETVSEDYPGQADGWSPIVSPDELDND